MTQDLNNVQRWTAKRRVALVTSILRGETTSKEAARKHGLTVAEVEDWQEKFLSGAENALRSRPKDDDALKDEHIKKLKQKIGDLVLDIDILKEGMRGHPSGGRCSTSRSVRRSCVGASCLPRHERLEKRRSQGIHEATPAMRPSEPAAGRAAAPAHPPAPDLRVSTALGDASATGAQCEPESCLQGAAGQTVDGAPATSHTHDHASRADAVELREATSVGRWT